VKGLTETSPNKVTNFDEDVWYPRHNTR